MFNPLDWSSWDEYKTGWSIADSLNPTEQKVQIFNLNVLGFQSHRDHFAVDLDRAVIEARAADMIGTILSDQQISEKYHVKSNRDWNIADARKKMRESVDWPVNVIKCSYRPFDDPFCYFSNEFMDYPRRELLDHVARKDTIVLVASRQIGTEHWRHAFVAANPPNDCLISVESSEANQAFPLWRFGKEDNSKAENFTRAFRAFIDSCYGHHYTPEEILGYIYGVLNASTYRTLYADFLRIDFPRIPFPKSFEHFEQLSELGWELAQAHLLRQLPRKGLAKYHGRGEHAVDAIRYSPQEEAIWINKTQSLKPVPQVVWDFHIGGYQVLDKYLKSRKSRNLSLDEINHIAAVANSLAFTIDQMAKIDQAYQDAFPDRG